MKYSWQLQRKEASSEDIFEAEKKIQSVLTDFPFKIKSGEY